MGSALIKNGVCIPVDCWLLKAWAVFVAAPAETIVFFSIYPSELGHHSDVFKSSIHPQADCPGPYIFVRFLWSLVQTVQVYTLLTNLTYFVTAHVQLLTILNWTFLNHFEPWKKSINFSFFHMRDTSAKDSILPDPRSSKFQPCLPFYVEDLIYSNFSRSPMIHISLWSMSQATPVRHGTNISIDDLRQDTLISEEQFPLAVLQKEPSGGYGCGSKV